MAEFALKVCKTFIIGSKTIDHVYTIQVRIQKLKLEGLTVVGSNSGAIFRSPFGPVQSPGRSRGPKGEAPGIPYLVG